MGLYSGQRPGAATTLLIGSTTHLTGICTGTLM